MLCSRANLIHSSQPLSPPWREGLRTRYCGRMVASSCALSSQALMPMSSSSSAMGIGDVWQSLAISCHCPARMGCSMLWIWKGARRWSFAIASSGWKAPLASTRSWMRSGPYFLRRAQSSSSSLSKSSAPIFTLIQRKPSASFSSIRRSIVGKSPIHTRPLIGMPASPRVKGVS